MGKTTESPEKQRNIPSKGRFKTHSEPRHAHRTKNHDLANIKEGQAGCHLWSPEAEKQATQQPKMEGKGAHTSPSPRDSVCNLSGWPTVPPTSSWDMDSPALPESQPESSYPGEMHAHQDSASQLTNSPSSLALGDAPPWAAAATCGLATEGTPHMPAALAMSLSLHSTVEQVSPQKMRSHSRSSHVRAEMRH